MGSICYGGVTRYESASCDRGKRSGGAYGRKWKPGDMTPPRSLSRRRSCRSAAAGVTCTRIRAKAYGMTRGAEKGCGAAVFP